jgi:hypothetical protein
MPNMNGYYPLSNIQRTDAAYDPKLSFAHPSELLGSGDTNIDPFTGEEKFARGGLASLAQSQGRGGDSMLVHMAPQEVAGLQQLALAHGGSLTINPNTGLVEANFLKSLLPTLIGAVLTPLTGGLINPMTAGLLVGGVEGIRTGDIGKGLMAGLGAYGGAGLSSALAGAGAAATKAGTSEAIKAAGTTAAQKAAETGATQAAQEAAKEAAMKELVESKVKEQLAGTGATATKGIFGRLPEGVASFKNIGAGAGEIFKTGGAGLGGIGGLNTAGAVTKNLALPAKIGLTSAAASALSPDVNMPNAEANIDNSYYEAGGYDPETGKFREGTWRTSYPGFPKPGYADGGGVAAPQEGEDLKKYYQSLLTPPPATSVSDMAIKDYMQGLNKFVTSPVERPKTTASTGTTTTGTGTTTTGTGTTTTGTGTGTTTTGTGTGTTTTGTGGETDPSSMEYWYANRFKNPQPFGTTVTGASNTSSATPGGRKWDSANGKFLPQDPNDDMSNMNMDDPMAMYGYAQGGIAQYAAGGKFLRGPGDGMSDDIHANINGRQEARLADGEFVVPADVVSHLGNGSSSAGARKLYTMMSDIRKARTGRAKQAPAVKTDKYLPR